MNKGKIRITGKDQYGNVVSETISVDTGSTSYSEHCYQSFGVPYGLSFVVRRFPWWKRLYLKFFPVRWKTIRKIY